MKPYTFFDLCLILIGPFALRPVFDDNLEYLGAVFAYALLLGFGKYFVLPAIFGNIDED